MFLRPYRERDISALVDIQIDCDKTDPLACYMVQNTNTCPATYRHTTLRFLRTKLLEPGTVALVAEVDQVDASPAATDIVARKVIGWSVWTRHGNSEVARSWQSPGRSMTSTIDAFLYGIQNRYFNALDPTMNREHVANIMPIISKPLDEGAFEESWELDGIYVSPAWQHHGAGAMLLQWGLTQAAKESVPLVCKSSSLAVPFYEHAGFRSLEKQAFDLYFDTGHKGYHTMCWQPKQGGKHDTVEDEQTAS